MKFSLILAPLVLLSDVVSAQSSLTDICTGSANNGCKTTITVPNGFKIVKSSKNVRSIQFNYIKVNICDQIRKALGTTLGNKFLKARDPICNCFTKLRTLNSEGKFTSSSAGNFDLANNYYLDQAGTLEKCLTDGGLKYSQSRDATLNKLKATGWQVVLGADIYAVFSNYLTASYKLLLGPIIPILNRWRDNLDLITKSTGYVMTATDNVKEAFNEVEYILSGYYDSICTEMDYCGSNRPNIRRFMTDVQIVINLSDKLSTGRQIFSFNTKTKSLLDDVNKLRSNWAYIPPANEMISKIRNNEIKVTKDVFKFMLVVGGMSTTSKKVATELGPLKSFVAEYLADSKALHELITRMLAIDWEKVNQGEFDNTDQTGYYVRNGLIAIQENMKKELAEAVKVYFWLIRATDSQLKDFTLTNGRWKTEYGTVEYQRWSTIDIDMPCTKITSTTAKKDGLTKTSNKYRTYWKCHFGPHTSQYQAVHVPYVRMYE
ncbi:uncharacterized protein FFB20_06783 [Fusarium fujikuroi]|uniref:Uncharacterized protein n=1 Tax=Fusarium fujikuroi TaxID=5127 RepID=A0A9Q9RF85_FUSFU|nr:uncharacterized protein FFB20_06783 [Fusarium fujikuroi]SCV60907.1 uncharacterized protein FFFS_15476 [Fusarium fujikuroi]VTT59354.1 unnamed protein product [Fusarium fujikuroi]